ncbi:MAG: hypothetical protein M3498_11200 [Deinococcota bacterium]|jgi:hypothetical protein|nr:hypothetical protein [Deinococcota bacterium]
MGMFQSVSLQGYLRPDPFDFDGVLTIGLTLDGEMRLMLFDAPEISYFPEGFNFDNFYELVEGELAVDTATMTDDLTLALTGSFSGVLAQKRGIMSEPDPTNTLEITGSFKIERATKGAEIE